MRLREFEEMNSQGKAVAVTVNSKLETLFVWISSKNWASGLFFVEFSLLLRAASSPT
jgi:hypothetical protein